MSGHLNMRAIRPAAAFCLGLVCATALSGCLTPRLKPTPSRAVVEARSAAGRKPAACGIDKLEDISPTVATFGFDLAVISQTGRQRLVRAAAWLKCNPGVEAVILPGAQNRGKPEHEKDLAAQRGQAVQAELRALGAGNVLRLMAPGATDPVQAPHLVIQAADRGW